MMKQRDEGCQMREKREESRRHFRENFCSFLSFSTPIQLGSPPLCNNNGVVGEEGKKMDRFACLASCQIWYYTYMIKWIT